MTEIQEICEFLASAEGKEALAKWRSQNLSTRVKVGFFLQGENSTTVEACANENSVWVEVTRKGTGLPITMKHELTPHFASSFARLLEQAAKKADQMGKR